MTYEDVDWIIQQVTTSMFRPELEPVLYTSSNYYCQGKYGDELEAPKATANVSGLQPHELLLKQGMPVMLLKNDAKGRYANGTPAVSEDLLFDDGAADGQLRKILCRLANGQVVAVRRCDFEIPLDQPADGLSADVLSGNILQGGNWRHVRDQFPIGPLFAMTIRKSQGKTLQAEGLYLPHAVRGHGDLYTALSRVSSMSNLRVLTGSRRHARDAMGTYTPNIVDKLLLAP